MLAARRRGRQRPKVGRVPLLTTKATATLKAMRSQKAVFAKGKQLLLLKRRLLPRRRKRKLPKVRIALLPHVTRDLRNFERF